MIEKFTEGQKVYITTKENTKNEWTIITKVISYWCKYTPAYRTTDNKFYQQIYTHESYDKAKEFIISMYEFERKNVFNHMHKLNLAINKWNESKESIDV